MSSGPGDEIFGPRPAEQSAPAANCARPRDDDDDGDELGGRLNSRPRSVCSPRGHSKVPVRPGAGADSLGVKLIRPAHLHWAHANRSRPQSLVPIGSGPFSSLSSARSCANEFQRYLGQLLAPVARWRRAAAARAAPKGARGPLQAMVRVDRRRRARALGSAKFKWALKNPRPRKMAPPAGLAAALATCPACECLWGRLGPQPIRPLRSHH